MASGDEALSVSMQQQQPRTEQVHRDLPEDAVAMVLAHLPLADRMSLARVNHNWAAAAAAATSDIFLGLRDNQQERAKGFLDYLQRHGRCINSLNVAMCPGAPMLAQLPCPALLSLALKHCDVQLGAAGDGVLYNCRTGLTSLKLHHCTVHPHENLAGLSVLVAFKDLELIYTRGEEGPAVLSCSSLAGMQHLTRLHLDNLHVQDVHDLGQLSSLSALSITHLSKDAPVVIPAALPASLKRLSVVGHVLLDPVVVFSGAQHLTRFDMGGMRGVTCQIVGSSFLEGLAGLQELEVLTIGTGVVMDWPPPGPDYQALTASTRLRQLVLSLHLTDSCLNQGVLGHMFSAARVRTALTRLHLGRWWVDAPYGYVRSLNAQSVSSIAACCPRLQSFEAPVVDADAVAALDALTGLIRMCLNP